MVSNFNVLFILVLIRLLCNNSVVFKHKGRVIVIVELVKDASPIELVPLIQLLIYEEHQLLVDEIVFLREGGMSRSRLSEKQRVRLQEAYIQGRLENIVFKFNTGKADLMETNSTGGTAPISNG
jgi:hypothetical protein